VYFIYFHSFVNLSSDDTRRQSSSPCLLVMIVGQTLSEEMWLWLLSAKPPILPALAARRVKLATSFQFCNASMEDFGNKNRHAASCKCTTEIDRCTLISYSLLTE
jgi:hypothetical protein